MAILSMNEQNKIKGFFKGKKIMPVVTTECLDVYPPIKPKIISQESKTTQNNNNGSMSPSPAYRLSTPMSSQKNWIEIFVKCRDLIKSNLLSKTDPLCVLYMKRYGQWWEYGRTETTTNCHKPMMFIESFRVEANNPDNQRLKFSIFDVDNINFKDLQKCRCLGATVEINVTNLTTDIFNEYEITSEEGNVVTGYISACPVKVKSGLDNKKKVCLNVGAVKIAKKTFFNRSDVFLEIRRELFSDTYHPVYRSEVLFKNNNPHWKQFTINAQKLCNGNVKQNLLLQVWKYNTKSEQELKGCIKTSLHHLLQFSGTVKELPLKKLSYSRTSLRKIQKQTGKDIQTGYIKLYQVSIDEQYSLTDYIAGGESIQCCIGVDFTFSNGEPSDPSSLHYLNENNNNQYKTVLQYIGGWMSHYSKRIKVLGFGGKIKKHSRDNSTRDNIENFHGSSITNINIGHESEAPNNNDMDKDNEDDYCFEFLCNGQPADNKNIEEVVSNYTRIISKVEPGGPTYFKQALQKLIPESLDSFSLVLLITDGVCNDETEFTDYILSLIDQPILYVIAGVGPCSFTAITHLVNRVNRKAKRQLLFFYHLLNKLKEQKDINELYGSLSKAVVDYFLKKNIHPKSPAETFEPEVGLDGTHSSSTLQPPSNSKSCCPTCGSHVNLQIIE